DSAMLVRGSAAAASGTEPSHVCAEPKLLSSSSDGSLTLADSLRPAAAGTTAVVRGRRI
ncbi:hypothetical protein G3M48_003373, partial [Beauveria asiatica]